ncbi:hypothetical protein [Streptomyces sp. NPDC054849]
METISHSAVAARVGAFAVDGATGFVVGFGACAAGGFGWAVVAEALGTAEGDAEGLGVGDGEGAGSADVAEPLPTTSRPRKEVNRLQTQKSPAPDR